MALVVEDGTGLSNAAGYVSVAAFKAYCDARGMDYSDYGTPEIEQAIVRATTYIDGYKRYKGSRKSVEQALEFPRNNLSDWGGLAVTGVPRQVANACAELAFKALSETLSVDLDRGGKVVTESVGPISVTYSDDAPAGKQYTAAHNMLAQFVRTDGGTPEPFFSPSQGEPAFSMTTLDFPGGSSGEQ